MIGIDSEVVVVRRSFILEGCTQVLPPLVSSTCPWLKLYMMVHQSKGEILAPFKKSVRQKPCRNYDNNLTLMIICSRAASWQNLSSC